MILHLDNDGDTCRCKTYCLVRGGVFVVIVIIEGIDVNECVSSSKRGGG